MKYVMLLALAAMVGCDNRKCHESMEVVFPRDAVRTCSVGAHIVVTEYGGSQLLVKCMCGPAVDGGE